ncbi:MAG: protein kinase [Candidatus Eiseniibacteriota bacterium]|nr:MAG: protein kinase [Candidatus Eisenbacteria bacterium]
MIGETVSHFKITEKLGGGGMGVVYKAEDIKLKRTVALKFLPPELTRDPNAKERFIQEARAASALDHPNICTIYETDETEDGQVFICMAYYKGEELKDRIAQGPMNLDEAVDITVQVAKGLAKAHGEGIVHRDIKPANIFMTENNEVKILDFGLAKLTGQTQLTAAGTTLGTAAYMSPEQALGEEVTHQTDIWSLGVVLFEMVTGELPFKGDYEPAIVYAILNETPKNVTALRPDAPVELEWVVKKAMNKDPGERYQNIEELLVDLRRLRKEEAVTGKIERPKFVDREARRRLLKKVRTVAIPVGIAVVLTAAFLVLKPRLFGPGGVVQRKPIAVISFENQTGDPAYDYLQEAIPSLLITSLEQSRFLSVTTWERMYDLLKQIGKQDVKLIDSELGFEVCRMDGIEAVVLGSFTKAGDMFATNVKVLDVETKRLLKSVSSKGEGVGSILRVQIDELSKEISQGIGVPDRPIGAATARIAEVTTNSMEAYNYFLKGREEYDKFYYNDARVFLEKAVETDSTFAVAYLYLAWAHDELKDDVSRDAAFEKAKTLSKKASDKERLYIEASYAKEIGKDPEERVRILKLMAKRYPKEKRVHYFLSTYYWGQKLYEQAVEHAEKTLALDPEYGPVINNLAYTYAEMGDFEKALENFQKYAKVSPGNANPLDSMGDIYLRMGRCDEAISKYTEAMEVKSGFGSDWKVAYVYALKEDYVQVMKWVDQYIAMAPSPARKAEGYLWRGFYHYWLGNMDQSLGDLREAEDLAIEIGSLPLKGAVDWMKGWVYYDSGQGGPSRTFFKRWYDFITGYFPAYSPFYTAEYKFYLGLLDVKDGNTSSARAGLKEMQSLLPDIAPGVQDWVVFYADLLHAEILLEEDSLDSAVLIAERISPWEMPTVGSSNLISYNLPFVKDVLARAYQRKGELDKAAATYERMMKIDAASPCRQLRHPKYHYRLAKVYEQKGETAKETAEYRKFLQIWKDADKELPEVKEARRRLGR